MVDISLPFFAPSIYLANFLLKHTDSKVDDSDLKRQAPTNFEISDLHRGWGTVFAQYKGHR